MPFERDYMWAESRLNEFGFLIEQAPGGRGWALTMPGPATGYLVFPEREAAVDFGMDHLERQIFTMKAPPMVLDHQIVVRVGQELYGALVADAEVNGRTISQSVRFLLKRATEGA